MPHRTLHYRGHASGRTGMANVKLDLFKGGNKASKATDNGRLYVRAIVMGYKGGLKNQYAHTSILRLENVNDAAAARFYAGKRVAYVYTAQTKNKEGSRYRCIWGKITRPHGTNGCVRAKFQSNLPPKSFGGRVRVMLYPSTI